MSAPDFTDETVDNSGDESDWDAGDSSSVALFAGDRGGLSRPQRDCLIHVLKHHYLSYDQRPALWEVLVEHLPLLESRLNDLFLTLHVDRAGRVAYKRQAVADTQSRSFPTLLRDASYTREETVVLVFLRGRLQRQRAGGGGTALVDREEIYERVAEFRSPDATDLVAEHKRAEKTIESLAKAGVLHASSEADRFLISPVLDSLLPLTKLQELRDWLRNETTSLADQDNDRDDKPGAVAEAGVAGTDPLDHPSAGGEVS
jgi:hypothetical protein